MTRIVLVLAMALAAGYATAAQIYRWVDDQGRVEWRDTPPPSTAKKIERRTVGGSLIETSTLPYGLQQSVKNFPVTLYVTNCGESCTQARAHLVRRGIPYTEKNPQADIDAYKKLTSGGMEVPLLFVGKETLKGYLESAWDNTLDAAGYPRQPVPGYVQPKPPASPPPAQPASAPAPAK